MSLAVTKVQNCATRAGISAAVSIVSLKLVPNSPPRNRLRVITFSSARGPSSWASLQPKAAVVRIAASSLFRMEVAACRGPGRLSSPPSIVPRQEEQLPEVSFRIRGELREVLFVRVAVLALENDPLGGGALDELLHHVHGLLEAALRTGLGHR